MGDAAKGRVDEEICRRDLPIKVGRKPRRFWSVRPLVTLPHTPGLSHSLPADKYCIGVRLDWVIHQHGYWRPTRVGGRLRCGLVLSWDAKSYNAGSLKTACSGIVTNRSHSNRRVTYGSNPAHGEA
jgi:hypothetical protein